MGIRGLHIAAVLAAATAGFYPDPECTDSVGDPLRFVGMTVPSRSVAVATPPSGVIEKLAVQEGDSVAAGQVLYELNAELEDLQVERWKITVSARTALRAAEARWLQARKEAERTTDLHRKQIAGDAELDERRRQAEVAKAQLDAAAAEHRQAQLRLREAKVRRAQRTVRSPLQGYVARVLAQQGEAVEELKPVVQVVSLQPLLVEFAADVAHAERIKPGAVVRVRQVHGAGKACRGRVVFASAVADPASQTFPVRVELLGEPGWRSGIKVAVEVGGR